VTKQEEINLFEHFIKSLPRESYLHPMMTGIQGQVIDAIRNDFACVDLHGLITEIIATRKELKDLSEKKLAETQEVGALTRQADKLRESINTIRSEARRLAMA
jgi:hypothetical protein